MNFVDVDLANEPLTPKDCKFIQDKNYPICILGFQLKNSYDQARLQIKEKYGFSDYIHFLPDSDATPVVIRGKIITPRADIQQLLRQCENFGTSLADLPHRRYEGLLSEYDLTCKNCYAFLQKGLYPIDGECIETFAKEKINLNDLYSDAFNTKKIPQFQSSAYFTIYILSNKSTFRQGTDKIVNDLQKKYNTENK
jgi:hypothetical protein